MKWITITVLVFLWIFSSCNMGKQEEALRKKEITLEQKEQDLLLKEKTLQIKEQQLLQRELKLDITSSIDTAQIINSAITGMWTVRMTCTETSCPGSAIGDTKSEQWNIAYQANKVIAKGLRHGYQAALFQWWI